MKRSILCMSMFLLAGTLVYAQQKADIPRVISYQGLLTSSQGSPLADGEYSITVTLYGDEQGSDKVWQDTYTAKVLGGVFNIYLGSGNTALPTPDRMNKALWIGTRVDGSEELRPLTRLSATPYAINVPDHAITTDKLADGAVTSDKVDMDYISGVSVNGKKIEGKGTVLNIQGGKDISVDYDDATQSIVIGSPQSRDTEGSVDKKNDRRLQGGPLDAWTMGGDGVIVPGAVGVLATPGNWIGTTLGSAIPFELRVNSIHAVRYEQTLFTTQTPNIIGGEAGNFINPNGEGNIIAGGGNNTTATTNLITGINNNTISGGTNNRITGDNQNTIGGGETNVIDNNFSNASTVGGGRGHIIGNAAFPTSVSTIAGGERNQILSDAGTIGGGRGNFIDNLSFTGTIAGGDFNSVINADHGVVGGGNNNVVSSLFGTISGGQTNNASGPFSTVGGGQNNTASLNHSTVGGGFQNQIQAPFGTVGGGAFNNVFAPSGTIAGGQNNGVFVNDGAIGGGTANIVQGQISTIAGGTGNQIFGGFGSISGGQINIIGPVDYAAIGGGQNNDVQAAWGKIGGGERNVIAAGSDHSIIGGGRQNQITGNLNVIGGGEVNVINSDRSVIGGGSGNRVLGPRGGIVGGEQNVINPNFNNSFIGGGFGNSISAPYAVIGGGFQNTNDGIESVIGGGRQNSIQAGVQQGFIGGGNRNQLLSNAGRGVATAIPGGDRLVAQSYGQTVIGVGNIPKGNVAVGAVPTLINEPIFTIGNATGGGNSNAFEVSYNGHSTVDGASNVTNGNASMRGATFVDNVIYAWGNVTAAGGRVCDFGVNPGAVGVQRLGVGWYRITMLIQDRNGVANLALPCGSVTATLNSNTNPSTAPIFSCRFIRATRIGAGNVFDIFISQNQIVAGVLQCVGVDDNFNFKVTGRP